MFHILTVSCFTLSSRVDLFALPILSVCMFACNPLETTMELIPLLYNDSSVPSAILKFNRIGIIEFY